MRTKAPYQRVCKAEPRPDAPYGELIRHDLVSRFPGGLGIAHWAYWCVFRYEEDTRNGIAREPRQARHRDLVALSAEHHAALAAAYAMGGREASVALFESYRVGGV